MQRTHCPFHSHGKLDGSKAGLKAPKISPGANNRSRWVLAPQGCQLALTRKAGACGLRPMQIIHE